MSAVSVDPRETLRQAVIAERASTGSLKAAIGHVSVAFGMTPRRVRGVWHGEPICLDWQEAERIRAVAKMRFEAELRAIEARQAWIRLQLQVGA